MTAPVIYWQRPLAARLDQQRRAIIGTSTKRIQPSWRKEKAA